MGSCKGCNVGWFKWSIFEIINLCFVVDIFEIINLRFVVDICDLVHDVEAIVNVNC